MKNTTTIELVGYGHPDRFADYISEKILFNHLKNDLSANVAVEVMVTKDKVFLGGEITSKAKVNYNEIIYESIEEIYGNWWPNGKNVEIINNIKTQSKELHKLQLKECVSGDQGVIFGYYSPKHYQMINDLYNKANSIIDEFNLAPDWKLLYYKEEQKMSISLCGANNKKLNIIRKKYPELIINPKGEWLIPGPLSDTGVTGRKLMIDTFGAGIPHGGGAFCGKDLTKVDKTGVIIATLLAKKIFEEKKLTNTDEVLVELSYKIGDKKPIAYAFYNDKKENINHYITKSLDEFIHSYKFQNVLWHNYVKKGGIIYLINDLIKDNISI